MTLEQIGRLVRRCYQRTFEQSYANGASRDEADVDAIHRSDRLRMWLRRRYR